MDPNTAYKCIGVEAYFYWWCNTNPDFGISSDEMAQLKSLCLVLSGLEIPKLPSCKFQFCLLVKCFISVNSGSCSHVNFDQAAVEEELDGLEYRMRLLPGLLPRDKQAGTSFRKYTWMNLVLISFYSLKVDGVNFSYLALL